MDLGLNGKVVLCMASAAGLGKGIAAELAREGAKVMLSGHHAERLAAAIQALPRN